MLLRSRPAHFHAHPAQLFVEMAQAQNGPPVIKENSYRLPHCNPTSDGEAFASNDPHAPWFLPWQHFARQKTGAKKDEADDKTGPALFEEMAKLEPVQFCPIGKVIMHSGFNQVLCVEVRSKLVHMNEQRDWIVQWKFLCPTNNEFFRVVIEVLLVERRRDPLS